MPSKTNPTSHIPVLQSLLRLVCRHGIATVVDALADIAGAFSGRQGDMYKEDSIFLATRTARGN